MGKPPETTHPACRKRRPATCGFANSARAARANSLVIVAGGLQAKGRLSFKTGVCALQYAVEFWPYVMNVLEDGYLELSNNVAEKAKEMPDDFIIYIDPDAFDDEMANNAEEGL